MKSLLLCTLVFSLVACCQSAVIDDVRSTGSKSAETDVPILTSNDQLDAHVGQVVTVRGMVTNTKIPTIIGVDVFTFDPDLRGKYAEAMGTLSRHVVTPEQLEGARYAHRGPGVFYVLKSLTEKSAAVVRPVSQ